MWNFNHKSQKRPVQLNSTLLHKELIKVTTGGEPSCPLLKVRTYELATGRPAKGKRREVTGHILEQLMESTTNHHNHTDQQFG